ncbi:hypothetical protein [Methyloversatilis thermotolerans]|uniref:hypothetical protein n=1 Tax=Methyloversatilis thermotolerans TaxID=1346290 RepID=UPI00035CEC81|nr:hypothetical protein [Methyloversatilis thermotolerans]
MTTMAGARSVAAFPARLMVAVALVAALALTLRYGFMQSDALLNLCATDTRDWRCAVRGMGPHLFMEERLGWLALAFAATAVLLRARALAMAAVLTGVAGMVLYAADQAAIAFLAGLWCLINRRGAVNRR